MPAPIASVISAYAKAAQAGSGMNARGVKDPGGDFMGLVKQAAEAAVETGRKSEVMTKKALAGEADVADVVTAVANAEVTLQTAVAIRDKVIAAYQDIIRMPI